MRRDQLARRLAQGRPHDVAQPVAANHVVALERLRPREEQRLLDVAANAMQLVAQGLEPDGVVRQGPRVCREVVQHQVGCRQRRLGLVDPRLNVLAILAHLPAVLGDLVVRRTGYLVQHVGREALLGQDGLLGHLRHQARVVRLARQVRQPRPPGAATGIRDEKRRHEGKRNHAAHQKRHVARGAGRQQDQRHKRQRHNHGDHCHRARPQPGAKPCHPSAARTSAARIPTRAHRTEYPWPRCVTSQSTTPIFSRA